MANETRQRQAVVKRNTSETRIGLELDLAGGPSEIATGIGFSTICLSRSLVMLT